MGQGPHSHRISLAVCPMPSAAGFGATAARCAAHCAAPGAARSGRVCRACRLGRRAAAAAALAAASGSAGCAAAGGPGPGRSAADRGGPELWRRCAGDGLAGSRRQHSRLEQTPGGRRPSPVPRAAASASAGAAAGGSCGGSAGSGDGVYTAGAEPQPSVPTRVGASGSGSSCTGPRGGRELPRAARPAAGARRRWAGARRRRQRGGRLYHRYSVWAAGGAAGCQR